MFPRSAWLANIFHVQSKRHRDAYPMATLNADKAIVWTLQVFEHSMRDAEWAQQWRLLNEHGPVGKVSNKRIIRDCMIEHFVHILPRQLLEPIVVPSCGSCPEGIQARQILWPDLIDYVVGDSTAMVWSGNSDQRLDINPFGFEVRDHVPRIQATHTVGNDIDAPALSVGLNALC